MTPAFITADLQAHLAPLTELNVEYLAWVFRELDRHFGVQFEAILGMSAQDYVPTVIAKVCGRAPPEGVFYLLAVQGQLAGMGGLRGLSPARAEIKRIYIRPPFRGMGLGERVLQRLMSDARHFGYQTVCLDSAPFMSAAQRVYEKNGFVDRDPYEGAEVPPEFHARWRFMERAL